MFAGVLATLRISVRSDPNFVNTFWIYLHLKHRAFLEMFRLKYTVSYSSGNVLTQTNLVTVTSKLPTTPKCYIIANSNMLKADKNTYVSYVNIQTSITFKISVLTKSISVEFIYKLRANFDQHHFLKLVHSI